MLIYKFSLFFAYCFNNLGCHLKSVMKLVWGQGLDLSAYLSCPEFFSIGLLLPFLWAFHLLVIRELNLILFQRH